jgi:N-acetylglutamate synthase
MVEIVTFTPGHIAPARALWERIEGVGLSSADQPAALSRYLERNPRLSFVAMADSEFVGAALCGHDGRRGYLHHLAIDTAWRRRGIGRALVDRCMGGLAEMGIEKCHVFVYRENLPGREFWRRAGWQVRSELVVMSAAVSISAVTPA